MKKLINSGISSIAIRIIGTGLAFALSIVLARTLGAEGFGIYSFVLSLLILFSIPIQAGFPNLAVREISKSHQDNDWLQIKGIWIWIVKLIIIYFIALSILFFITYFFEIYWISIDRLDVFLVGFILIPLIAMLALNGAYLRGLSRVIIGIIPDTIIRPGLTLLVVLLTIVIFSKESITPYSAMMFYVLSIFIAFCISLFFMWRFTPKENRNLTLFSIEATKWKQAAYPLSIVGGLQLMYSYVDVIILGIFHSNEDVGVYRAVGQLGTLVVFGLTAINQMLHPYFSKLYTKNDIKELQKVVMYSSIAIFTFATIPALAFLLGGEFILKFIFGEEFVLGFVPLAILTLGQLANALFGSVGALLNMTGHEKDAMRGMFYSLFVNIVLAFMLIPPFGIIGASIATAISLLTWNIILHYYVKKRLNIESIGFIQIIKQRNFK